jgi:hypothetical protein
MMEPAGEHGVTGELAGLVGQRDEDRLGDVLGEIRSRVMRRAAAWTRFKWRRTSSAKAASERRSAKSRRSWESGRGVTFPVVAAGRKSGQGKMRWKARSSWVLDYQLE